MSLKSAVLFVVPTRQSAQAKERKDEQDDDHKPDQIDDTVHGALSECRTAHRSAVRVELTGGSCAGSGAQLQPDGCVSRDPYRVPSRSATRSEASAETVNACGTEALPADYATQ